MKYPKLYLYNYYCDPVLYEAGFTALKDFLKSINVDPEYIEDIGTNFIDVFGEEVLTKHFDIEAIDNFFDDFINRFYPVHYIYQARDYLNVPIEYALAKYSNNDLDIRQNVNIYNKAGFMVLTSDKRFSGYLGASYTQNQWAVASTVEPEGLKASRDIFITAVLHEFGHLCGLPDENRKQHWIEGDNVKENYNDESLMILEAHNPNNIAYSHGWHCLNKCIMRQRNTFTSWHNVITVDRLNGSFPFCELCMNGIKEYFGV